jgi:hypothetical protein
MSFFSWLGIRRTTSRRRTAGITPRPKYRLYVERLEDRSVPASYSVATVPELIAAMNAANLTAEADTIALVAGATYTLSAIDNFTFPSGPNGLPTIVTGEDLTIAGNGATLERSAAAGTPVFRLFRVAAGASLRLENLTVQGGLLLGGTGLGVLAGGAIYNQGTLTLSGVTVQNNTVSGYSQSNPATGGGIFSTGTLTVENCRIQNNRAIGGRGDRFMDGGTGSGGGLYVSAGTALLTNVTLSANIAQGGAGGDGSNYHHAGEGGKTPGGNGGNGHRRRLVHRKSCPALAGCLHRDQRETQQG